MKTLNQLLFLVFLFVCIGLGVSLVYYGINRVVLVYQSLGWAEASGQITSSKVGSVKYNKGSIGYSPDVKYRYVVSGVSYEGDVISYGFINDGGRKYADEKVSLYPIGSSVKVFYNPNSPSESCLEVGGSILGFSLPIITGTTLTVFGIWVFIRSRNYKRLSYASRNSFWK